MRSTNLYISKMPRVLDLAPSDTVQHRIRREAVSKHTLANCFRAYTCIVSRCNWNMPKTAKVKWSLSNTGGRSPTRKYCRRSDRILSFDSVLHMFSKLILQTDLLIFLRDWPTMPQHHHIFVLLDIVNREIFYLYGECECYLTSHPGYSSLKMSVILSAQWRGQQPLRFVVTLLMWTPKGWACFLGKFEQY